MFQQQTNTFEAGVQWPSMAAMFQPGSRPRCQMEALQCETEFKYTIGRHVGVVQYKMSTRHLQSSKVAGVSCMRLAVRRDWEQTAYCWHWSVAGVEVQRDCFQGETSSIECIQNTTRRSISNGVDASALRYQRQNRAERGGRDGSGTSSTWR